LGLLVTLMLYVAFIVHNFAPAITEPDDNGYFAQGSLLAQTGHTYFAAESDAQFIGMHWLVTPKEQYISRYPPGLAVVIAIVYKALGYKASLWVNPGLSVLALLAVFLVGRRLTSGGWALLATAMLAMNPQFVHHALSGDSHMGVTCMLGWTIYFLVRWWQAPSIPSVLLAGLCFGCIPTIRYPDAIMAIGIAAFLISGIRQLRTEREKKSNVPFLKGTLLFFGLFAVGAAVPIIPLLVRNQVLLGAFWRTGYALTNEQTGFSWTYFREHALTYIQSLNSGGVGLLLGLGLVGIVTMICHRASRALGVMFALICLPMLLLYMAYYWEPQMNSGATMRFLLPTFPAYVLAGVWMLATFLKESPRAARVAVPLTLLIVQGLWGASDLMSETNRIRYSKEMLARVTDELDEVASAGDVVVSNNQILQNLDFVRKWKLADEQVLRRAPGGGAGGGRFGRAMGPDGDDSDEPSPMQRAKLEEQMKKYPGSQSQQEAKFASDVAAWAGAHHIYLVGSEGEVRDGIDGEGKVKIVARIDLPNPPAVQMSGGMRAPGGGMMRGRGRFGGAGGMGGGMGGMGGPPMGGIGPMGGGMGRRPAAFGGESSEGSRQVVIAEWIPNGRSIENAARSLSASAR
jgi:4-amino-4-deoxy-L-arabinose transferase-like glycosyltransferase